MIFVFVGRGDPTLSLSCSDKMLKWNLVGLQGSLLSSILEKPGEQFSNVFCQSLKIRLDCKFSLNIHSNFTTERKFELNQTLSNA
jgi:hypothetical protein